MGNIEIMTTTSTIRNIAANNLHWITRLKAPKSVADSSVVAADVSDKPIVDRTETKKRFKKIPADRETPWAGRGAPVRLHNGS